MCLKGAYVMLTGMEPDWHSLKPDRQVRARLVSEPKGAGFVSSRWV